MGTIHWQILKQVQEDALLAAHLPEYPPKLVRLLTEILPANAGQGDPDFTGTGF